MQYNNIANFIGIFGLIGLFLGSTGFIAFHFLSPREELLEGKSIEIKMLN